MIFGNGSLFVGLQIHNQFDITVIVADVTSHATSSAAAKFLLKVIKEMSFKIKSIQVDGGSEFMLDFENECEKAQIPLYVLPPSRPQS